MGMVFVIYDSVEKHHYHVFRIINNRAMSDAVYRKERKINREKKTIMALCSLANDGNNKTKTASNR